MRISGYENPTFSDGRNFFINNIQEPRFYRDGGLYTWIQSGEDGFSFEEARIGWGPWFDSGLKVENDDLILRGYEIAYFNRSGDLLSVEGTEVQPASGIGYDERIDFERSAVTSRKYQIGVDCEIPLRPEFIHDSEADVYYLHGDIAALYDSFEQVAPEDDYDIGVDLAFDIDEASLEAFERAIEGGNKLAAEAAECVRAHLAMEEEMAAQK